MSDGRRGILNSIRQAVQQLRTVEVKRHAGQVRSRMAPRLADCAATAVRVRRALRRDAPARHPACCRQASALRCCGDLRGDFRREIVLALLDALADHEQRKGVDLRARGLEHLLDRFLVVAQRTAGSAARLPSGTSARCLRPSSRRSRPACPIRRPSARRCCVPSGSDRRARPRSIPIPASSPRCAWRHPCPSASRRP